MDRTTIQENFFKNFQKNQGAKKASEGARKASVDCTLITNRERGLLSTPDYHTEVKLKLWAPIS